MNKMGMMTPKPAAKLTGVANARSRGGNAYAKGIAKRAAPKAMKALKMGRKK